MSNVKLVIYGLIGMFVVYSIFFSGSDDSSDQDWVTEEVVTPTTGVITTMQEIEPNEFRITDEQTIDDPANSLIIANYLDNTSDTLTLDQAKAIAANTSSSDTTQTYRRRSSFTSMAMYGFMGYMMGRSMSSPVRSGAYMDQKTYNRVNNNTGTRMNNTAQRTTTRKPSGKSGYGSGGSTRSYGG